MNSKQVLIDLVNELCHRLNQTTDEWRYAGDFANGETRVMEINKADPKVNHPINLDEAFRLCLYGHCRAGSASTIWGFWRWMPASNELLLFPDAWVGEGGEGEFASVTKSEAGYYAITETDGATDHPDIGAAKRHCEDAWREYEKRKQVKPRQVKPKYRMVDTEYEQAREKSLKGKWVTRWEASATGGMLHCLMVDGEEVGMVEPVGDCFLANGDYRHKHGTLSAAKRKVRKLLKEAA